MEKLIDRARGYAVLRVVGAQPTMLLDSLAAEDIAFWGVEPVDELTLLFRARLAGAARASALAERCGCELALIKRRGLPVAAEKARKRYVLWVLPLLLLVLLIFSSFFIWKIEITGNETVSEIEILNALEDSGVYIGSFWPDFTSDSIRSEILIQIPELKWLSVSLFGSRALVEVRERTEIPVLLDENEAVKVIAGEAGIIERMSVLRGYALFKKGQTAAAGDTLITGAVPSSFAETTILHAEGSVLARTWFEICAVMPLAYEEKSYTGAESSRYALILGNTRINFYGNSRISDTNCDKIISERRLGIAGLFELPLIWVKETTLPYERLAAERAQETAKARLEALTAAVLTHRAGEAGEIKSAEFTFSVVDGFAVGTLRAECKQDIAAEAEMTADEIQAALSAGKDQNTP